MSSNSFEIFTTTHIKKWSENFWLSSSWLVWWPPPHRFEEATDCKEKKCTRSLQEPPEATGNQHHQWQSSVKLMLMLTITFSCCLSISHDHSGNTAGQPKAVEECWRERWDGWWQREEDRDEKLMKLMDSACFNDAPSLFLSHSSIWAPPGDVVSSLRWAGKWWRGCVQSDVAVLTGYVFPFRMPRQLCNSWRFPCRWVSRMYRWRGHTAKLLQLLISFLSGVRETLCRTLLPLHVWAPAQRVPPGSSWMPQLVSSWSRWALRTENGPIRLKRTKHGKIRENQTGACLLHLA